MKKDYKNIELLLGFLMFMGLQSSAQDMRTAPKLVVNITIDQLRSDYLEHFSNIYSTEGFQKLWKEGRVYEAASYPFSPVDRASAITCLATGCTPQYNKIAAEYYFNRKTLRPEFCVNDEKYGYSPVHIATSTISDELKVASNGEALVYGIAWDKDAAILSAGHAANGAFWVDPQTHKWTTSSYYSTSSSTWIKAYNASPDFKPSDRQNDIVTQAAYDCIRTNNLGLDDVTDYLAMTLSARYGDTMGVRTEMGGVYASLDYTLTIFLDKVERKVGRNNVLFIITGTGYADMPKVDYSPYHIPTGTFYINRTAQLLNMYLSAIYGTGNWVEGYYNNQIFLNHKLIEDKTIVYSELINRSKEMLSWAEGVARVDNSLYDTERMGDLVIEVSPGWKVVNEDTGVSYQTSNAFIPFPIIFYGKDVKPAHILTPITTDRIAPTIASSIHIRAPNACISAPLNNN